MPGFHSHVPYVCNVLAVTIAVVLLCRFVRTVAVKIGVYSIATERQLRQISATGQQNFFYVGYVVFTVDT